MKKYKNCAKNNQILKRQEDERLRQEEEQRRLGEEKSFQIEIEKNENEYYKNIREKNDRRLKEEEKKKKTLSNLKKLQIITLIIIK